MPDRNMIASLIVSTVFAAASPPPVQEVRHSFAAEQADCVAGGPRSRAEEARIEREWRSDGSLHVEFWAKETGDRRLNRDWSLARLSGDTLTISYRFDPIERIPGEPMAACLIPVRVKMDFFGLHRQSYRLRSEIVSASDLGTIDE